MRAAEAAKTTANLIEGTVKKVKDGSEVVVQANAAFQQVAGSAGKAADLVAEISVASKEQAQGIDRINAAVAEMDKVIQQNAANADESASASEELNAQAAQMQGMVVELHLLRCGRSFSRGRDAIQALPAARRAEAQVVRGAGRLAAVAGLPAVDQVRLADEGPAHGDEIAHALCDQPLGHG
jgi:methyl-accepting chemotaxis protein